MIGQSIFVKYPFCTFSRFFLINRAITLINLTVISLIGIRSRIEEFPAVSETVTLTLSLTDWLAFKFTEKFKQ